MKAVTQKAMSTDLRNSVGMDSTVDTDGKSRDAALDRPANYPNVIGCNASPSGSVPTDEVGLAGFDSRPGGNLPAIAGDGDYQVEHLGVALERPSWRNTEDTERHDPENGVRVSRMVRISPKKKVGA